MNIHILGICGAAQSAIAVMLAQQGHTITGTDQDAYPPATDYLDAHQITYFDHYDPDHITGQIDLVLVGGNANHLGKPNPELAATQQHQITVTSWAQYIGQLFDNPHRLVIAGTYGKTTITALCSHIANTAGLQPSYLIGDKLLDDTPQLGYNPDSQWAILEGDEHPAVIDFDPHPKFAYYHPTQVILTSTLWDHFNVYPTRESYLQPFQQLLQSPELQTIFVHADVSQQILTQTNAQIITYSDTQHFSAKSDGQLQFTENDHTHSIQSPLIGQHNFENILAAVTWARYNQIPWAAIQTAIQTFPGIARRLQPITDPTATTPVYQDMGQHPQKAAAAINSLKSIYPDHQLLVALDPHASVLKDPHSLPLYPAAFKSADHVIIGRLKSATNAVTGKQIADTLNHANIPAAYIPKDEKLVQQLLEYTQTKPSVVLFLSSGNFRGLIDQFVDQVSETPVISSVRSEELND